MKRVFSNGGNSLKWRMGTQVYREGVGTKVSYKILKENNHILCEITVTATLDAALNEPNLLPDTLRPSGKVQYVYGSDGTDISVVSINSDGDFDYTEVGAVSIAAGEKFIFQWFM